MDKVRVLLVAPNLELTQAWQREFAQYADVRVVCGLFETQEFDCLVSAANSFGLMDGGVDLAIRDFFGMQLQERVQAKIVSDYLGEQPVGTSFVVETGDPKHPFVAHTPTMRVPMPIAHTDYVYLAMRAALLAVHQHNQTQTRKINVLACPGLGTATGQVSASEAARQMALAYQSILCPPAYLDWERATDVQQKVIFGGDLGMHLDI